MNNRINVYHKNTHGVVVLISGIDSLTGYTPYLTVKKRSSDTVNILQKTGVVSDPSTCVQFSLSAADTSLGIGDYIYDVTIVSPTVTRTVVKDVLTILDNVYN